MMRIFWMWIFEIMSMKKLIYLFPLFLTTYGCSQKKVSLDPHYPNIGITRKTLEKNGWVLTSGIEGGVCVFESKVKYPQMIFYGSTREDCAKINSQDFSIQLEYFHEYRFETILPNEDFEIMRKDELLLEIHKILKRYDATLIGQLEKINPCLIQLYSKNQEDNKIKWHINLCQKAPKNMTHPIDMSAYYEL